MIFHNFWKLRQLRQFFDNFEKTVLESCDIWDTDYSSDNWEPEFMTIFVTWQLIVTLDSICNYCDVNRCSELRVSEPTVCRPHKNAFHEISIYDILNSFVWEMNITVWQMMVLVTDDCSVSCTSRICTSPTSVLSVFLESWMLTRHK